MKFAVASLFTLALTLGVQGSILPLAGVHTEVAGHGLSYTAVSSPAVVGAGYAPWPLAHGGAVVVGPSAPLVVGPSPAVAVVGAGLAAHGHGHGHGHDATYVAKTPGAVHAAPLAGHLNSVANVNLLAAPGTHH